MLPIIRSIRISRFQCLILTALWISLLPNAATLTALVKASASASLVQASAFVLGGWLLAFATTLLLALTLSLFFPGRSVRAMCAVLLVVAATLGYFSFFLGTQFDKTMLLNMLQTHASETLELVSMRLLLWIVFVGVLPAVVVLQLGHSANDSISIRRQYVRSIALSAATVVGVLSLTAGLVFAQYSRYASTARSRAINFHTVAPANIVAAGVALAASLRDANTVRAPRGLDAHQSYAIEKPRLFVFILGETARAQNHGLNGYERDTTPRMRQNGGYYFPDTESCGTATAMSVPCIFSGFSREQFSLSAGRSNETLIDVLLHGGARVIWRDNDSGCKGVCDRADVEDFTNSANAKWCPEPGNCFDEILLQGLEEKIRRDRKDTLVVLHLKGSHGPAYYKRYPPAFEQFQPVCQSSDLASCDLQTIRNAYDNTILYTDHVVGETTRLLQRLGDQFATALLYVSDHGESLGESGLFLHGMPYSVAPKEQTRVPMYAWVSPQFIKMERWDAACMAKQTSVQRSHDNVYSTVLGFLEIDTNEYKKELDLFEPCDEQTDVAYKGAPKK
jgi:lipid A ethanolaminephosphotransferase